MSTYLPSSSHHILVLYAGVRLVESKSNVWIRHQCSHPVHTANPCQNAGDRRPSIRMDHRGIIHIVPIVPDSWPTPISSLQLIRCCSYFIPSCHIVFNAITTFLILACWLNPNRLLSKLIQTWGYGETPDSAMEFSDKLSGITYHAHERLFCTHFGAFKHCSAQFTGCFWIERCVGVAKGLCVGLRALQTPQIL